MKRFKVQYNKLVDSFVMARDIKEAEAKIKRQLQHMEKIDNSKVTLLTLIEDK